MKMPTANGKALERGFSLIELMIAMTIGIFMTGVIAMLYFNMRSSFRYQDDFARVQESGRFSMDMLARDIRMAGYNGCGTLTDFANTVNGGATSSYLNFRKPVIGFEGGVSTFPAEITAAGAITATGSPTGAGIPDAIIVMGVDTSKEWVVTDHVASSAVIHTTTHDIQTGELLLITDCSHASLFQKTPSSATNHINHNEGAAISPGNCYKGLGASCTSAEKNYTYPPGASVLRVYSNAYFIAPSSLGNGRRSLYTMSIANTTDGTPDAKELIEGVQNMQLLYGVDTNADNSADRFIKANSVDTLTDGWSKVVSVRIELLVMSAKSDAASKVMSLTFDNLTLSPTDKSLYKTYQDVVTVRNRTP